MAAMYQPPLVPRISRQAKFGTWLILALPVALGLFMSIETPSYFLPLSQNPVGWLILGLIAILESASFLATRWGLRRFEARPAADLFFRMSVMVGLVFPTLWLVLLGPAIVIIMKSKGG
jgi:hypothetical protein